MYMNACRQIYVFEVQKCDLKHFPAESCKGDL